MVIGALLWCDSIGALQEQGFPRESECIIAIFFFGVIFEVLLLRSVFLWQPRNNEEALQLRKT